MCLLLGTLIAWAALPSQANAQRTNVSTARSFGMAGRVVNAITGQAVSHATVSVLDEEDNHVMASTLSGSEGQFVLPPLPAGKYPLTAARRGYRTAFYDEHENFNSAIVTGPTQDTQHLVFRLTPDAELQGVISDDEGDAVEGATVMLFNRSADEAEGIVRVQTATTDDIGAYEFGNLPAGNYLVAVQGKPWYARTRPRGAAAASGQSSVDVAYPVTYFDSTTEEDSATPIALGAGSREEANIVLHAVPALHLVVPGAAARGLPPGNLSEVVFGSPLPTQADSLSIRDVGTEFSGVAPGHYQLTHGNPPRLSDLNATSDQQIDSAAGTPMVPVDGALAMSNGSPVPEDIDILLKPAAAGSAVQPMITMARHGRFAYPAVAPGRWQVVAELAGQPLQVVALRAGEAVRAGNEFVAGDAGTHLVLSISRAKARIRGVATADGHGAAGVMVVLVPRDPNAFPALARRDQTDSDGSFMLRDVAAGQYTVVAIRDGWKLDWKHWSVIRRFLSDGVAVTVGESSAAVVQLPRAVPAVVR